MYNFQYFTPNILKDPNIDYKIIIHRTLFWDSNFPPELKPIINDFNSKTTNFIHILWKESHLLNIMNDCEKKIYSLYSTKIQKADFGRYIILLKYGGIYADLDIKLFNNNLNNLLNKLDTCSFIGFQESFINRYALLKPADHLIRKTLPISKLLEYPFRIANYLMISKPNSIIIKKIIKLCILRSPLPVIVNYDILFITGPDVVSTVINEHPTQLLDYYIFKKPYIDTVFKHICNGHWK